MHTRAVSFDGTDVGEGKNRRKIKTPVSLKKYTATLILLH